MKRALYLLGCLLVFGMAACYDDDSRLADPAHPEITIGELRDTTIVSFSGNILPYKPQVTAGYPEEALIYAWYYYSDKDVSITGDGLPNGCRERKIADTKELAYEVNLASGKYTFVFEAKAEKDGYSCLQKANVTVITPFSDRYYVLKETADGQTELDLHNPQASRHNVLAELDTPMKGKPLNLGYTFNQAYVDNRTLEQVNARAMYLFGEEETRVYEMENFNRIFDRTTLGFEPFTGVRPCAVFTLFASGMLSEKGFYFAYPGDMGGITGQYGLSLGAGGSRFVQVMQSRYPFYWSDSEHGIYSSDYNCSAPREVKFDMPADVDCSTLECLGCGMFKQGKVVWFLVKDGAGSRFLIVVNSVSGRVSEVRALDASLRLASADIVAGNTLQAKIIYFVSGNKLWAYGIDEKNEYEVSLPGMGDGETITYVSNQYMYGGFFVDYGFDNLLVATHDDGKYKLYVYNMIGGIPQKEDMEVYKGEGRVCSVRYAVPVDVPSAYLVMGMGVLYPVCD